MAMKLYVGSLSYDTTEETLREAFSQHGTVDTVDVIVDKHTGRSKGFAFVEMSNDDEAKAAMSALNNVELDGRNIVVSEARPRERTGGGGGRGFGRGGGGRRY